MQGHSAQTASDGFLQFYSQVKAKLPAVSFVYVSVMISPMVMYMQHEAIVTMANSLVQQSIGPEVAFCNLALEPRFATEQSLYINDGIHLTDAGHVLLAAKIKPLLTEMWAKKTRDRKI